MIISDLSYLETGSKFSKIVISGGIDTAQLVVTKPVLLNYKDDWCGTPPKPFPLPKPKILVDKIAQ